jgi:hypothetical protein
VKSGEITVEAQGDGLKADNAEDAARGYISIEAGVLNITSGGDAIEAETVVMITAGELVIQAAGDSGRKAGRFVGMRQWRGH